MSKKHKPNAAQRRLERVRAAFCADDLIRICQMSQDSFSDYAHRVDLEPTRGWRGNQTDNFFFYRDNGAPILAVAHLDHVQDDGSCQVVDTLGGPLALSGALDDRLGAYVILEMLPKLGIKCDWLLTTNEEMGQSSAQYFAIDKPYNWMIEFDRAGTDVVMYQYDTPELRDLLRSVNAYPAQGSYSDIADLEYLGCSGFNWGVGYEDYHSERSHAWLDDTFKMVAKFMRFYSANATTHLPYEPRSRSTGNLTATELYASTWICPRCDSDLDNWSCCRSCGYGVPEKLEGEGS